MPGRTPLYLVMSRLSALPLAFMILTSCVADDELLDAQEDQDSGEFEVIGGVAANGDPSIVAILAQTGGGTSLCTGTVISSRAVLTAAHCVDPAVIGQNARFQVVVVANGRQQRLAVASTAFDPQWNPNQLQNGHDVGIVRLAQATNLRPIPVSRAAPNLGQPVRIVGFGSNQHDNSGSGVKRQAQVAIAGINDRLIQLGDSTRQTCHGDSGGPALQRINGQEVIVGITSFGQDRPQNDTVCFNGGFDTRVDFVLPFIDQND